MPVNLKSNPQKALEVLLYVAKQCPDVYGTLKVVFFADLAHLSRYGRPIYGDRYVNMEYGPVASNLYDIIKDVREDRKIVPLQEPAKESLAVEGNTITPRRAANLDYLSESDIECLNESLARHGEMSFQSLYSKSHGEEYPGVKLNAIIPMELLIKHLPNGKALWDYLNS